MLKIGVLGAGPVLIGADGPARLARLRRIAWLTDGALRLPGTKFRFGLGGLIGLPPGLGDAALAGVSLLIVWEAWRMGVPKALITRMLGNVAIEFAIGTVPVLGDIFDMAFKANLRNLALLDAYFASVTCPRGEAVRRTV